MRTSRSLAKTICYRAISWGGTALLAWFLVPLHGVAVFATVDAVGNTMVYFLFELTWTALESRTAKPKAARTEWKSSIPSLETGIATMLMD